MDGWTIIRTFVSPQEAYLVKNYLESAGMITILQDEMTVQVNNFYSAAVGGVKLWVRNEELEECVKLLKEGRYLADSDLMQEGMYEEIEGSEEKKRCPFCHSDDIVRYREGNALTCFVYSLLGILFPMFRKGWKCNKCQRIWKYKRN